MSLPSQSNANVIPTPDWNPAPANQAKTVSTLSASKDTLPAKGYTVDQLVAYIKRSLGEPQFDVELETQQIVDQVYDALNTYSVWRPRLCYHSLMLTFGVYEYLKNVDTGMGVVECTFVEPNPVPTELFYGNLIDPAPLFRTGLDEYDTFLRWRKVWMRVTSVRPDWLWDDDRNVLFIHNPIQRYHCGVLTHGYYKDTTWLPVYGAQWVKKYALAKARFEYADVMNKFSGAIPGPIKDLQLGTSQRLEDANKKIEDLEAELKSAQISTPISIDAIIGVLIPWGIVAASLGTMFTC